MDHFYQDVPGWFFKEDELLFKMAIDSVKDSGHFVEIGSWKGRSAAFMAVEIINSGKSIQFDCVDTWQGSEEHQAGASAEDPDVLNGTLFQAFERNMQPVTGHYRAIKTDSLAAAQTYTDNSLDFVFIDAAHDYNSVCLDICAWFPKVKPGGIISGDDCQVESVRQAVNNTLPKFGYSEVYTINKTWYFIK